MCEHTNNINIIKDYNKDKKFKITFSSGEVSIYHLESMLNVMELPIELFDQTFISMSIKFTNGNITIERITE